MIAYSKLHIDDASRCLARGNKKNEKNYNTQYLSFFFDEEEFITTVMSRKLDAAMADLGAQIPVTKQEVHCTANVVR